MEVGTLVDLGSWDQSPRKGVKNAKGNGRQAAWLRPACGRGARAGPPVLREPVDGAVDGEAEGVVGVAADAVADLDEAGDVGGLEGAGAVPPVLQVRSRVRTRRRPMRVMAISPSRVVTPAPSIGLPSTSRRKAL